MSEAKKPRKKREGVVGGIWDFIAGIGSAIAMWFVS